MTVLRAAREEAHNRCGNITILTLYLVMGFCTCITTYLINQHNNDIYIYNYIYLIIVVINKIYKIKAYINTYTLMYPIV